MTDHSNRHLRASLKIADSPYTGLVKHDAKDPEAKFPAVQSLRPPAGAPNVPILLLDVGNERASPVSEGCPMPTSTFNGSIKWVQLDAGVEDFDHIISLEERLRVAMARQ